MTVFAVGVYDLGLTTAALLDLTYAEYLALDERRLLNDERDDRRFALLALRIVTALGAKRLDGFPLALSDFMETAQPTAAEPMPQGPEPYMKDVDGAIARIKGAFPNLGRWSTEPYGE